MTSISLLSRSGYWINLDYAKQVFVFNIDYVDFEAFGILMNHDVVVVIQSTKDYALFSKFSNLAILDSLHW